MAANAVGEILTEEDELQTFREAWMSEVSVRRNQEEDNKNLEQKSNASNIEKARDYFQKGIDFERNGKLSEAVQCYRQATQLDPEIEQRMFDTFEIMQSSEDKSDTPRMVDQTDLMKKFSSLDIDATSQSVDEGTISTQSMHITELPDEILIYIFRWVASSDLDLASVEKLSEVSRKFYVLARDQCVWQAACQKVWGLHAQLNHFRSWRTMFIERPQVRFDGVYISKVSYFRQGDPALMYKPFYCVEYYRYIRFYSNGKMLFYTTPEEPINVVSKLSLENAETYNFRVGQFKLTSNQFEISANITAILTDAEKKRGVKTTKKGRRRDDIKYIITDKQYFVDLEVTSSSSKKRFNKLTWVKYSSRCVFGGGKSEISDYNLSDQFPPFYFSKVKSYNEYSHESL